VKAVAAELTGFMVLAVEQPRRGLLSVPTHHTASFHTHSSLFFSSSSSSFSLSSLSSSSKSSSFSSSSSSSSSCSGVYKVSVNDTDSCITK
jgi:hypothetical protein